ncbi:MAG: AAA family ATPase [Candidatus ainarchaeum sp.]|nr:AAA family ATPase [Candidatus ainarchaeum sp.]
MDPQFIELSEKAREDGKKFTKKRFIFNEVERLSKGRVFVALVGPRGVGKTVVLKQLMPSASKSFYLPADSLNAADSLFLIAKELGEKGVKLLLIDEIHAVRSFQKELKRIYDSLDIQVVFTSSCSISLFDSAYDLSRRARLVRMAPFSFREYIWFKSGVRLPALSIEAMLDLEKSRNFYSSCIPYEPDFERYLKGANHPFAEGDEDSRELFRNILSAILSRDIFYSGNTTREDQNEMERILSFMGKSPVEDINYSSISRNVGITKYKAESHLSMLEKAFVINRIFPRGSNVLKEPKALFSIPYRLLYRDYPDCIGALREDFFAGAFLSSGFGISYLKTTRGAKTPDFAVGGTVFEIGGKGKGLSQFKGTTYSRKLILTQPGMIDRFRRPLFFAGML